MKRDAGLDRLPATGMEKRELSRGRIDKIWLDMGSEVARRPSHLVLPTLNAMFCF